MTDQELESLLADLESDRVERKQSVSDGDKIRQAICAFANDLPDHRAPGVVFVGATDEGLPSGLQITDRLLLTLSDMRSDGNILPIPQMTVQKRVLSGNELAVIDVCPALAPPVRFKGVVWVRVGPRRATASEQEERTLSEKRRFKNMPFDAQPAADAPMDALDELLFRQTYLRAAVAPEVLAQNHRRLAAQLVAVRFAHPGPPECPTNLGLLVIGKTPTDYIPAAYVQFLRIDGEKLTDPIKSTNELRGPLSQLLGGCDELLRINISTATDITSQNLEIRHPDYPLVALQQLARNAIMHRAYEGTNAPVRLTWFNDRVEIQNAGGPFGQVTTQNFGQPGITDYRNPYLAEAMRTLGYVQRFGMGISLAREAMAANGNPPPEFLVDNSHVAVILRRRK